MPRVHEPLYDADGNCIGHTTRFVERKICSSCGRPGATQLCDYRLATGKTCDRPLCKHCAVMQKPVWGQKDRIDYCPAHARLVEAERDKTALACFMKHEERHG